MSKTVDKYVVDDDVVGALNAEECFTIERQAA